MFVSDSQSTDLNEIKVEKDFEEYALPALSEDTYTRLDYYLKKEAMFQKERKIEQILQSQTSNMDNDLYQKAVCSVFDQLHKAFEDIQALSYNQYKVRVERIVFDRIKVEFYDLIHYPECMGTTYNIE